jgi:hypothetical protein
MLGGCWVLLGKCWVFGRPTPVVAAQCTASANTLECVGSSGTTMYPTGHVPFKV